MIETWIQVASSVVIGAITAILADWRGRSQSVWFFIGMFFGPFGLLSLFLLPKVGEAVSDGQSEKTPPLTKINKGKSFDSELRDSTPKGVIEQVRNERKSVSAPEAMPMKVKKEVSQLDFQDLQESLWFYVYKGQKKAEGPVKLDVLLQLWENRKIDGDSLVWCDLLTNWIKVGECQALQEYIQEAQS